VTYILGIDAGATKTFALVADSAGPLLGFGRQASDAYSGNGPFVYSCRIRGRLVSDLDDARGSSRRRSHQLALERDGDGLGAALDLELGKDVADVRFDGVLREAELGCHCLVAGAGYQQAQHF
jgi:hypothetical protein